MPRPIAAGVLGMARTTLPPHTSEIEAMVVPAMIDTTSVEASVKDFSIAPASRNDCGFSAITSGATAPKSLGDGLRRIPFATSALISSEGCGSITTTRLPSSPCASQPDSNAPPIFPAPARTMVVLISCKALVVFEVIRNKYLRRPCERRDP